MRFASTTPRLSRLAALLAACVLAGPAAAAVILSDEGVGFVGKGDIQALFGWNNEQLQTNAAGIEFFYVSDQIYVEWQCEWTTGKNNTVHTQTRSATVQAINASIAFDARKNKNGQVTGFNLLGWGPTLSGDTFEPECPGNAGGGKVVEGSVVTYATGGDAIYVRFGDLQYQLNLFTE